VCAEHEAAAPAGGGSAAIPVPAPAERRGHWSEARARDLLAAAGVPVVPAVLARSAGEAVAAAARFGGAVAVKVVSPRLLHKTDAGGVALGVSRPDAVRAAFARVTGAARPADVEGVLISPMRAEGVDLLVGVVRDPVWGLMLAVAIGGVLAEVVHDAALAPLPVTRTTVRRLLGSLRASAVLDGARGAAPADLDALADAVVRFTELAGALGAELESLEINPLRVDGSRVEALDAVVTWRDAAAHGEELG